jgi:hypothetical protein
MFSFWYLIPPKKDLVGRNFPILYIYKYIFYLKQNPTFSLVICKINLWAFKEIKENKPEIYKHILHETFLLKYIIHAYYSMSCCCRTQQILATIIIKIKHNTIKKIIYTTQMSIKHTCIYYTFRAAM